MAKKSMVVKNIRRRRISDRYRERRLELKKILKSTKASHDEKKVSQNKSWKASSWFQS